MAKPLDSGERHALSAYLRSVEVHAEQYLRDEIPVLAPGDLEGALIHAGAIIAVGFARRFKSLLEQRWNEWEDEHSRITSLTDLPPTGDGSEPAGQASANTSESTESRSRQKTREWWRRRVQRLLQRL